MATIKFVVISFPHSVFNYAFHVVVPLAMVLRWGSIEDTQCIVARGSSYDIGVSD